MIFDSDLDIYFYSKSDMEKAINLVIAQGGIEYAYKRMMELTNEALSLLISIPDSEAKRSIIAMFEYTTQREK